MRCETELPEFVVLRHDVGPRLARPADTHFDWMFHVGDTLRTWTTAPLEDLRQSTEIACQALSDHRLAYLQFEGDLGAGRGCVTRVLAGRFALIHDGDHRFVAQLQECDQIGVREAHVEIYRKFSRTDDVRVDDSRGGLLLRFSPGRYDTNR